MQLRVLGMLLLILLVGNSAPAKPFKGGELRTHASFLYGRFEVRMRSAAGSGVVSSFFTYHVTPSLPAQWNEIDIEILGRYSGQLDFNIITQGEVQHPVTQTVPFNPHQNFHVYAIEWTPDYVAWRVDGYEIYRETAAHVGQLFYPQRNMMNIWVPTNTTWAGTFDPSILPVYAYYDWVKYYEYTPGVNDNFTLVWSDEFDSWNQGRWGKGNHTWNGNRVDLIPENVVFHNGYLVLCLTDSIHLGYSGAPIVDIDDVPPYMVWARAYPDHVKVFFSEPLDPVSAGDVANYTIPSLTITGASLLPDQRTVRLDVLIPDPTVSYNLIASGINDLAQPPNTMGTQVLLTIPPLPFPIQVNLAGDPWQNYLGDQVYTSIREYGRTGGYEVHHPSNLQIHNTTEDEVYRAELRDPTFYQVRLPEGQYNVTLMFAETQFNSPSARLFNVYAEGQQVLSNFNIYGAAGFQMNTAVERTIENLPVTDGVLDLYFEDILAEPVISGIRIEPAPMGISRPSDQVPSRFEWSIYPNPFNPTTTVEYRLPRAGAVTLTLYDLQGRRVQQLFQGRQPAGTHRVQLDGSELSSGVYLVVLNFGNTARQARKIVLLK